LSDSSESNSDNNVNSYNSYKYLFNLHVNNSFDIFEEAGKKLDSYFLQQKKIDPSCMIKPVIGDMDSELKEIFWQLDEQIQLLTRF
ncbi:8199_t:CDS:2, partial [Scutellospora calospora]